MPIGVLATLLVFWWRRRRARAAYEAHRAEMERAPEPAAYDDGPLPPPRPCRCHRDPRRRAKCPHCGGVEWHARCTNCGRARFPGAAGQWCDVCLSAVGGG